MLALWIGVNLIDALILGWILYRDDDSWVTLSGLIVMGMGAVQVGLFGLRWHWHWQAQWPVGGSRLPNPWVVAIMIGAISHLISPDDASKRQIAVVAFWASLAMIPLGVIFRPWAVV